MQVITIGIDLAKNVFQVHGVDANDQVVFSKPLRRSQILPFFAKLAPRRRVCHLEAGARPSREIPLADATVGAQAGEGCCSRTS
jgi:transposase